MSRRDDEYQEGRPDDVDAIRIAGGKLHELSDALEQCLTDNPNAGVYQRSGSLVEISTIPSSNHDLIERANDAHVIARITSTRLRELGTKYAVWQRYDKRSDQWRNVDCPRDVAETLACRSNWQLPVLKAVLGAPTINNNGALINTPGYNPDSGVYLHMGKWQGINKKPKQKDAIKARETLEQLIAEFPFVDEPSRSVWMAALLTALTRWSLRTAPFFGFDAPVMGSGKSLLATLVGYLINGHEPAAMTQSKDENEARKIIMSALMAGDPILLIDNIEYPIAGEVLCSVATSETYRDRVLGKSEMVSASTAVTVVLTGNNLTVRGDLSTRILVARLDPAMEHPEEREFRIPDIRKYALENRQDLVNAALTILLAYEQAGRPDCGLKPFGRFEDWSTRIRAPLVWAGAADPCDTRTRVESVDPEREQHHELITAWWEAFEAQPVTVQHMVAECTSDLNRDMEKYQNMREAMELIAKDGSKINTRRLGGRLKRWEGRIFNGLRIARHSMSHGRQSWVLQQVTGGYGGSDGLHDRNSKKCQTVSGKGAKQTTSNHQTTPAVQQAIEQACEGLSLTPADLLKQFSENDLADIETGRMSAKELRDLAEYLNGEKK